MTARSTRVGFVRSSIHESSKPRGLDSAKMSHESEVIRQMERQLVEVAFRSDHHALMRNI